MVSTDEPPSINPFVNDAAGFGAELDAELLHALAIDRHQRAPRIFDRRPFDDAALQQFARQKTALESHLVKINTDTAEEAILGE